MVRLVRWGSLHHPSVSVLLTWCSLCLGDSQNQAFSAAVAEAASGCGSRVATERGCPGAGGFGPLPPCHCQEAWVLPSSVGLGWLSCSQDTYAPCTRCWGLLSLSPSVMVLGRAGAAIQPLATVLPCFIYWPWAATVGCICSSSKLAVLIRELNAGEC